MTDYWEARARYIDRAAESSLRAFVQGPRRIEHEWLSRKRAAGWWELDQKELASRMNRSMLPPPRHGIVERLREVLR